LLTLIYASGAGPEGSGKLTVAPLNVFGKDLVTVATSSAALARWTARTAERAKEIRQSENPWTLKFETGLRRLGIIGRAKAVMFIGGKLFSELLG
jgi:alanine racemase